MKRLTLFLLISLVPLRAFGALATTAGVAEKQPLNETLSLLSTNTTTGTGRIVLESAAGAGGSAPVGTVLQTDAGLTSGLVKLSSQTNLVAAVAGTDYQEPLGYSPVSKSGGTDNTGTLYFPTLAAGQFQQYQDTVTYGANVTLDWSSTNLHTITLTGDIAFAFSNVETNRTIRLRLIGDSSNRTITWPAGIHGGPATVSTANKWMLVSGIAFGATDASTFVMTAEEP